MFLNHFHQKPGFLSEYFYMGDIQVHRVVKHGKWADNRYARDFYPKYAAGASGYVLSKKIIEYFSDNYDNLYPYPNEDASIGIYLDRAPFHDEIQYFSVQNSLMVWTGHKNCNTDRLVVGHHLDDVAMDVCMTGQRKLGNIE